ncbi:PAS domain S-box protein [Chelatococcus sp. GCM10030263]|uniref:hybrid sensor histidine kinase/response regulator n=1 Tax=Chelatococcus sp. GCM10030263 TaxID=3273387 RepID=UPI00361C72D0
MENVDRFEASQSDEGRYRLLVDAITDYAIYMLDPTGLITSWNSGAQRFKGYEAYEIIGEHFSRFYTEEEKAAGIPQLALKVAAEEGRFEREGWRVRKDGTRFWAHVVIDPIRQPSGKLVGYAKITRDLTERRAAEEALRQSERQFRLLVQGVTDYAIYMLDREGRISNWNAGAQRIKGYLPDEVIGEHFSKFYTDEDREAGIPFTGLETAAREGRWEKEGWRVRKDGSRFWAHVIIDAIRDDSGEVIGFAKVTRDITERMQAQRALDAAREALFQSQKMDAIGQLTGGIAHDFNNLLMAVLGSLELVRKRLPYDPRITPLLDNAMQGAQRGATLTQRMLAFARRQELKLEAVDLASLVRGMMAFLQRTIGPTIEIEARFSASLPRAHTDPNQLETALLNLVVNARDAMPEGGTIRISARHETIGSTSLPLREGEYVCLQVADTGEGMDKETLQRATEPFFTTKGVGKGTGLGLPMVHGLAAQSGGRLDIHSRKGEGTTIELWLPIAPADQVAAGPSSEPAVAPGPDVQPLEILVVDDDGLVLMNTAAMLEDLGHVVLQATSGRQALEEFERHPDIDLVITDQAMPHMTGLQLIEAMRSVRPDLPVIVATGYAEMPPLPGPALPRLAKPFSQEDLARSVTAVVEANSATRRERD